MQLFQKIIPSLTTELRVTEVGTMVDEFLKSLLMKMIPGLKSDTNKPMNSMFYLERHTTAKEKVNRRTNKTRNIEENLAKKLRFFLE